ncbi:MAG TPA: proline dehydrogenase family protein [Moheibacter sp.]|nr:proline dehydrogenase family protein [Moheibacter sp.]
MSLFDDSQTAFEPKSDQELKKAKQLFQLMSQPLLTKMGAVFFELPFATDLPFVKTMIRRTIYQHFVGGETPTQCLKVAKELHRYGVSSIMDYSVEGQEDEASFDHVRDEILSLIQIAKENPEEVPFVVFKPTGFGRISLYEKVGLKQTMTAEEEQAWQNIRARIETVCQAAYDQKVLIMADAEHSWMQDAADDLMEEMMQRFNQKECIVWSTLQMYRHDRLAYLKQIHQKASEAGYLLGFKIVRGAYMELERARAKEKGYQDPIQADKASTDRDYNAALEFILSHHDRISIFAGTHNEKSSELLIRLIDQQSLNKASKGVWFGQLYGMSDNISFKLGSLGYNTSKYLPYGPIKKVMPYLIRRAQENTSVAGQTSRELLLIDDEIQRRKKIR